MEIQRQPGESRGMEPTKPIPHDRYERRRDHRMGRSKVNGFKSLSNLCPAHKLFGHGTMARDERYYAGCADRHFERIIHLLLWSPIACRWKRRSHTLLL